ncbi:TonB-dependent receptor [Fulvitalea axinellae]|uniref:TonB-dependent receptor n=1 Tax=Fulvitalea axinellae TaxID=1182444 RepID=A0AAU9DF12_9BACT|nr:TonB-dependent receptor [Fulvitalea axinellae]
MRHRILLILALLLCNLTWAQQQGKLSGRVVDEKTGNAVEGALIELLGLEITAKTDGQGVYLLSPVPAGHQKIRISHDEYETVERLISVSAGIETKMGDVQLAFVGEDTDAIITLDANIQQEDSDTDGENISSLLASSRDVFQNKAAYTFGRYRFKIRGYNSENTGVYLSGSPMNDPESGRVYWSNWGGLNDVLRNSTITNSLDQADNTLGFIGGSTNIDLSASKQRKGLKLTYSSLQGSYKNRLMATYSTGLMENGWAFTVAGSRRWAQEGYIDGTFYDSYSYFLGVEKVFNDNHRLSFTTFGSPTKRASSSGSPAYVYELAGDNFYNPNWGYQDGEVRNARETSSFKPTFILSDVWDINDNLKWVNTLTYMKSYYGKTALNWQNTDDPRPNYYKRLQNEDEDVQQELQDRFRNDVSYRQLNWDAFYATNQNNGLSKAGFVYENGKATPIGKDYNRSLYIVEDRRNDSDQVNFTSMLSSTLNDNVSLRGGVNYTWYKARRYNEVEDLLGGDYWLDIDQFAERDGFASDNDVRYPDRLTQEGDVISHDYDVNIKTGNVWALSSFTYNKVDFYIGAGLTQTQYWRTGNMQNGKFENNSLGDSEKKNFTDYHIKGGATYKINGRNYIVSNLSYQTRAPFFSDAFVSPRTRNQYVDDLKSEKIFSSDLAYVFRSPYAKFSVKGYYTKFSDKTDVFSFFHDDKKTFVNYVMTNIEEVSRGFEFGGEYKVSPSVTVNAAGAIGLYYYNDNPNITGYQDNNNQQFDSGTPEIKNLRRGGSPQTALSLGARYQSPKYWSVGFDANYFANNYVDLFPVTRDPNITDNNDKMLWQEAEELPNFFTLDLNARKSWRINGTYVSLSLNVNNLFDKQVEVSGYEQRRYSVDGRYEFPSTVFYSYGRTYFLNLSISL